MMRSYLEMVLTLAIVTPAIAYAGGGGCGDWCDKKKQILNCPSVETTLANPATLAYEYDIRNVKAMQNRLKEASLAVHLYATTWSVHPFNSNDITEVWIERLAVGQIFPDKPVKVDPISGLFDFYGFGHPGWDVVRIRIERRDKWHSAWLTLTSLKTGIALLTAKLDCIETN